MIRLIKPYISYEDVEQDFKKVFESGIFTRGENVDRFVQEIQRYTQARFAFLTTSATTALGLCLKILSILPGDEVIVSDFSFPATANVVEDLGARPVFADVDLNTYNMRPEELEKKITTKTKAVIFVDALGNPSGITKIKEICIAHKIPLIEDAACAMGSSEAGVKCGNIADLTCFSFHPRKLINTGEGGAITTNNIEYASKLKIKLNHGSVINNGKYDFVDFGYNFRLPELQSIMGLRQLEKIDAIVAQRNTVRDQVAVGLCGAGFKSQTKGDNVIHNVQSVVFTIPDSVNRDSLINYLADCGIESTIGTYCLSNTSYYRKVYNQVQPNAKFLEEHTITLPCYDGVDCDLIASKILGYIIN